MIAGGEKQVVCKEQCPVVLIVEDEEGLRCCLRSFLEDKDYAVIEAENGREGLETFEIESPDLVLLDLRMPEMGGLEVLAKIRNCSPDTPVIVISGAGVVRDVVEALRLGAWDYLTKPILELSVLEYAIERSLERARLLRESRSHREHLEEEVAKRTEEITRHREHLEDLVAERTTELQAERDYSARIISGCPVIICGISADGTTHFVNPAGSRITGYRADEIIGKNWWNIFYPGSEYDQVERLFHSLEAGDVVDYEMELTTKDGEKRTIAWNSLNRFDSSGRLVEVIGFGNDVTEMRKHEEDLREAKAEAERANAAKSEFLANMSHEIRTPMNGVIGMTALLLDTDLSLEQRKFAETIGKSADALLTLVNGILDFSKIEAGKLELQSVDFDLRVTLEDINDLLAPRAQSKGLEYVSVVHPEVPSLLRGDPGRLRQIAINLVGNAIKFTLEGKVNLRVTVESENETGVVLRFEVADTGIGIPEDRQHGLFNAFTQADASTTSRFGGTGLGLSISKRLVEMMGGSIGVESTEGVGSVFSFTAVFEKGPPQAAPHAAPTQEIGGARILVVDENAASRHHLSSLLDEWNWRHSEVRDAESALGAMRSAVTEGDPFRIAILDMHMAGTNGEALGERIKDDPLLSETLLVMMTNFGSRGDVERLGRVGFSAYLRKPVKPSLLHECLLAVHGNTRSPSNAGGGRMVTRFTLAEDRRRSVRILLAEDNPTNQEVAVGVLRKLGYNVDLVENGRDAIRALGSTDYDLVLMDCQMPEMDGYEATREIRNPASTTRNHDIPVIAMTAAAARNERAKCIEAGMNDHLAKPVSPDALGRMVERWLADTKPSTREDAPTPPVEPDLEVVDFTSLRDRLLGDDHLVGRMVDRFIEDVPERIQALREAIEKGDLRLVRRQAHTIKGAAGNLCARSLHQIAVQVEQTSQEGNLGELSDLALAMEKRFEILRKALLRNRQETSEAQDEDSNRGRRYDITSHS